MFWMGATMDIQQNLPAPIYINYIFTHILYGTLESSGNVQ